MSKKTRQVQVGSVRIGGGAPVSVQSMTNTDTADVEKTLSQIRALTVAGADIVRVSVYNEACADAVRALVDGSPVPLVADIHFDYKLAIKAVENGIHKLRINPGNIGGEKNVRILADCVKAHHIPVRIGVNSGSVEKDILAKYGGPTPQGMVESALAHAKMLENCGFYDMVLSMKASNVPDTVAAYRLASAQCDYPLHLGVTEAGLPEQGKIKSAIGIGALLLTAELAASLTPLVAGGTGSASDSELLPPYLPDRLESGTPNLPGIYGLRAALAFVEQQGVERLRRHELALCERFLDGIAPLSGVRLCGTREPGRRVGVISVDLPGRDNAEAAFRLEQEFGILTRCGLHCAPAAHRSLGTFPQGTIRFSLGFANTEQDVDAAVAALRAISAG